MSAPTPLEEPIQIPCEGTSMWGILSHPPVGTPSLPLAVLIVVGGPQYRVGSHRQFVLLARALACRGVTALRFDCRGMGDSAGALRTFEQIEDDLRAALSALRRHVPTIEHHVIWGLCDAAAAALMFGSADASVVGIVAANPWARSDATLGAVRVKHYYGRRLLEAQFWRKVLSGAFDWRGSWHSLLDNLRKMSAVGAQQRDEASPGMFQSRMAAGWRSFRGQVLLLISGNDLTAQEFLQFARSAEDWNGLLRGNGVTQVNVPDADHTFSRRAWANQAERATVDWVCKLAPVAQTLSEAT
jgi:exosortase A-associated hydrolase 1